MVYLFHIFPPLNTEGKLEDYFFKSERKGRNLND